MRRVAAAPLVFDDLPVSSPELALVDADLAAQLRADLTSGETFRPRPAPRPEYPALVFDAVVLDLAEADLTADEDCERSSDEADEPSDDAVATAGADPIDDATDEHEGTEALMPPVLEALPTPDEHTFELPDYILVSDDDVVDAIPDYIVVPEGELLPALPEDIAPAADERVEEVVPDPVLPDYVVMPEEVAATAPHYAGPAADETIVEDVPDAVLPEYIVRDDVSAPEVAAQASAEEAHSTSDYPMLPDLEERSDALEETEAALRRIREQMGIPAAPTGPRKRRFRRRFTVFAGLFAVATLTAAAEAQLGIAHAPGFLSF